LVNNAKKKKYQLYENIYWNKLSMISPIIHSSKIYKKMDNTYVKLQMIIVSYVYKKPIIIIEHRSKHKFQMSKEDSQISNLITHDNMIHFQNWILSKSASLKHVFLKGHANYTIFHIQ
jgi:hypothetical protein